MTDSLPREHFEAQAVVFKAGEDGDAAFVIEKGSVEILGGPEQHTGIVLSEGSLFGEVALLDHLPRSATVRTLGPTTLIRIDRDHVDELLRQADPVIQYLLKLLLERFRYWLPTGLSGTPGADDNGGAGKAEDIRQAALRTLLLTRDLSHALDAGQLELFYQPLIGLADRTILGYEALIRWRHPTQGMILPMEFIGLAEKTGLIRRLGRWVLQRAAADWEHLQRYCSRAGGRQPFVSVNLSATDLGDADIVAYVQSCLAKHGMTPQALKIELTETVVIHDIARVGAVLEKLASTGIAIALDDFGTGYAGLETLKTLPISCIKIDRNFVQSMPTELRAYEIVQSAINLAWSLGLTTIAEGIEDAKAAGQLLELGCEIAQGYHFARPMPAADIAAWAKERDASAATG